MAPDIYMSGLQHQMVSSMGRDLWRFQPWTVSSVVGPVTTLLQAEQMGMGSGPGRARQSQRKMWSPNQLYTFSPKRNSGRRLLGRFPGTGWVGLCGWWWWWWWGSTGQRSQRVKGNPQGKSGHLVCHQTGHCLQALTLQPHHRLGRLWR